MLYLPTYKIHNNVRIIKEQLGKVALDLIYHLNIYSKCSKILI